MACGSFGVLRLAAACSSQLICLTTKCTCIHWYRKGAPDRPGNTPSSPVAVEPESGEPTSKATPEQPAPEKRASEEPGSGEPESEEPSGITSPTPGKENGEAVGAPEASEGPLNVEHQHFGPDISKEDDDDDALPSTGLPHESFGGVPSAPPPPPPAAVQEPASADGDIDVRGHDDLTWPTASNGTATASATESKGYLTKTVGRLEDVVGQLSGMVEKMMGVAPSQNVYVTNNYNNVTVKNANVTNMGGNHQYVVGSAESGWAQASGQVEPEPTILPYPAMWPYGGVYADQVVVHLEDDVNGSSLYYSVNASGTQGDPKEYTEPFVLGPGWTKVEAVAIKSGYNASIIREAVFQVMNCNGDKCCNWRVVYLRFEAVLARLLNRKQEIPKELVSKQAAKDAAEVGWLNAQSKYQDAKISEKSAVSGAEYARSFQRKWGFAFSDSQSDLEGMEKKVTRKLRELLDERELIMDILSKLDSDALSASRAMGMLQQSLAECSACKAWRSIASSPDGDGAATTFALASTLGGHQEVKDVNAILQEILNDLDARRALYEKMLLGARLQVDDNQKKLNKWTNEAAKMSAQVYEDKQKISEYGKKGQELSGKVEVAKQALQRGKEFMQDDMDILERHISAIRRILKRIRVALANCPEGAPEERFPAPAPRAASDTAPASASTNSRVSYTSQKDVSGTMGGSHSDQESESDRFLENAASQFGSIDSKDNSDSDRVLRDANVLEKSGNQRVSSSSQIDESNSKGSSDSERFLKDADVLEKLKNQRVSSSSRTDDSDFKLNR